MWGLTTGALKRKEGLRQDCEPLWAFPQQAITLMLGWVSRLPFWVNRTRVTNSVPSAQTSPGAWRLAVSVMQLL